RRLGCRSPQREEGGACVTMLPDEFIDLEPFAEKWCLATEPQRYAMRLSTGMVEIRAFYDTMAPRVAAAIDYCDRFPLEAMPPPVAHLMPLLCPFITASSPVGVGAQPRVPAGGPASPPSVQGPVRGAGRSSCAPPVGWTAGPVSPPPPP